MIRHIANKPPNSSEIAEKIKSLSTTGILVGNPLLSPIPSQLPVPIAKEIEISETLLYLCVPEDLAMPSP